MYKFEIEAKDLADFRMKAFSISQDDLDDMKINDSKGVTIPKYSIEITELD